MNPFELRGPEFLLFYLALGFTVLGVVVLRRRVMEPSGPLQERLTDPLAIAYLRGGPGAAVSVAALDLLERRALAANEGTLTLVPESAVAKPAPLERAVLVAAEQPATFRSLVRDEGVKRELDVLRDGLVGQGLLPDGTQKVARWLSALTGLGLLAGVAGSKIHTALELGKSNIVFLILMWAGFTALLAWKASPRRTPRGERTLKDLGELLSRVRTVPPAERREDVATPAYATNDLLLMAALFGMTALPGPVQEAYGRALPRTSDATSWGGCGAFSDGGSGDGGGGDGGASGCGGCGGGGD